MDRTDLTNLIHSPSNPSLPQKKSSLFTWGVLGIFLVVTLLVFILDAIFETSWLLGWKLSLGAVIIILFGFMVFLGIQRISEVFERQNYLLIQLEKSDRLTTLAYQRLRAVFQISQKFVDASDEQEIIQLVLHSCVELVGAAGASFVPLDERGQPMPAISFGKQPFPIPEDWIEYLASPAIRSSCQVCEKYGMFTSECPLLKGPFSDVKGIYCLPLRRGEHEFGVINLYLPDQEGLDEEAQAFLRSMFDETALALESVRLRQREIATISQLQAVRQKTDRNVLLSNLLENAVQSLEVDFAVLVARDFEAPNESGIGEMLVHGNLPEAARPFVEDTLRQVLVSQQPVMDGDLNAETASQTGVRAVLAVPLNASLSLGAILVASSQRQTLHARQLGLLRAVASQVSMVLHNSQQMARLEYQTIIEERTRLAREIHDGLAQTIGFLKLQMAQMQGYLDRGENERLKNSMKTSYQVLAEAYQDARYAIDGLRIFPSGYNIASWMQQILGEFQESSGSGKPPDLHTDITVKTDLPPEVQAQLIRILQEALSNVRKHAEARQVWVTLTECPNEMILEVRDDGLGFFTQDIAGPSQHGLKGMRERAELIGARLQVISKPQQGTTVRVTLPVGIREVIV